jgi:3',5'-cyclic AMP phosphodiesterase CpdA
MTSLTRQIHIVHLSDIHFGDRHTFNPELPASGGAVAVPGHPTVLQKLLEDLREPDPGCPVIVCITGDVATKASGEEFARTEEFVRGLAEAAVYGKVRGLESIFLVAGNHDVVFTGETERERCARWFDFTNRLLSRSEALGHPRDADEVRDLIDEIGVVVVCINSSMYVQQRTPDEVRGRIDHSQLDFIESQLERIEGDRLDSAIRVALIHHHPVLIPDLAEAGRGYDAVHDSGRLLSLLRKYGFHLVLHGHKHNAYTFTEDSRSAFRTDDHQPILIAAGGSLSSRELPPGKDACNCYNRITVKWHPAARQARLRVETRGLAQYDQHGVPLLPARWRWRTLRRDDRHFYAGRCVPTPRRFPRVELSEADLRRRNDARSREYQRLRGNMPVAEVMPSLDPDQAYEVRLWIEPHRKDGTIRRELPVEVTWFAGDNFPAIRLTPDVDSHFCTKLDYWGPFLAQAALKFSDGCEELTHIYAMMPQSYSTD